MKTEVFETYEALSDRAAGLVAAQLRRKPDSVLGLPTGETPIGLYDRLSALCAAGELDFSRVTTFNLDEYYPISPEHPQSYRYFMNKHLFSRVNVPPTSTHVPDGAAEDADAACADYEALIRGAGGVDLQVLGIGRNGHIGFNEPGTPFDSPTHWVTLTESTVEANARLFASKREVPPHALTMGIGTILRAREILILITGKEKREALRQLLSGTVSESCPATALQRHENVTILCDRAAYGG